MDAYASLSRRKQGFETPTGANDFRILVFRAKDWDGAEQISEQIFFLLEARSFDVAVGI